MAMVKKVKSRELFMGKLSHGSDVLEELTAVCRRENIRLGRVEALGAVQQAQDETTGLPLWPLAD